MQIMKIKIPKGYMNVGVTVSNHLVGDTNDSSNWDEFRIPLPKPSDKWEVKSQEGDELELIDKGNKVSVEKKVNKMIDYLTKDNETRLERIRISEHTEPYLRLLKRRHNYVTEIIQRLKYCL